MLIVLTSAGVLASRSLNARIGLTGTYYNRFDWSAEAFTVHDPEIATTRLRRQAAVFGSNVYSVIWRGVIAIPRDGTYSLATWSDDGSEILIDSVPVVDNRGVHRREGRLGRAVLRRGFHPIEIRYQQAGGGPALDLMWHAEGEMWTALPKTALLPRPMSWLRYRLEVLLRSWMPLAPFAWLALAAAWLVSRYREPWIRALGLAGGSTLRSMTALAAAASVVLVVGIGWGFAVPSWTPDEIEPDGVIRAAARLAESFGIETHHPAMTATELYPPLHYHVLGLLYVPFWAAAAAAGMELSELYFPLLALSRLVSTLMALGILLAAFAMARAWRCAAAGLTAAFIVALLPSFIYYGKTANVEVPYVFWAVWALYFYVQALQRDRPDDYWRFAAFAMAAVCTKDEAYGLFVFPAAHLAAHRWSVLRRSGTPWLRTIPDPALLRALAAAALTFVVVQNFILDPSAFIAHAQFVTAHGGTVPPTVSGHAQLLASSLSQLRWCFGWPMWLAVVTAVVGTALAPGSRRRCWMLLPAVSYYVCFIAAVRVNFDRFFLPVLVLLAVLAGCWAQDVLERIRGRGARWLAGAAAALVVAYTAAYGLSLDLMMLFDSRYAALRWILEHADEDRIGTVGYVYYLPTIAGFQNQPLTYDVLVNAPPRIVVVNTEHLVRYHAGTAEARVIEKLREGTTYRLALSHKTAFPGSPLAAQPQFVNRVEDGLTNLDKINPEIQIFERRH